MCQPARLLNSTCPDLNWIVKNHRASQVVLVVMNPPANAGDVRDTRSIPGLGRSHGGGHGNPLQYSCLENPMDRGAWRATVHRVTKSQTRLKRTNIPRTRQPASSFHSLEREVLLFARLAFSWGHQCSFKNVSWVVSFVLFWFSAFCKLQSTWLSWSVSFTCQARPLLVSL